MSVSINFSGRTALVTGERRESASRSRRCSTGPGRRLLCSTGIPRPSRRRGPDTLGRVIICALDVSDSVAAAVVSSSGLGIAVNSAGITRGTVVRKMTDEQRNAVLAVHLGGTFAVTRAVILLMRAAGYGRIDNVTSYTVLHGAVGPANYAAAEGGIVAFTTTVAKETARFGITVNAISPNAATPMVAAVGEEAVGRDDRDDPAGPVRRGRLDGDRSRLRDVRGERLRHRGGLARGRRAGDVSVWSADPSNWGRSAWDREEPRVVS